MKKFIVSLMAVALVGTMVFALGGKDNGKSVSITSPDDLAKLNVGCQAGTTGENFMQENYPNTKLSSFRNGIEAALALKNNLLDAVILDELPARAIVANNPNLKIIDLKMEPEEYAIAVRKGDSDLLASINRTIATIQQNGEYDMLTKSFMPTDGEIKIPATINTIGQVIRMGTNAQFPPFEYYEGTKPVGFDISMSEMIARDYGKRLEVVDMDFGGLIAALQSGAIDFIAAGMTATDERRKNVDFSDTYYRSSQMIIVRK